MNTSRRVASWAMISAIGLGIGSFRLNAEVLVFNLDPARSAITLSGTVAGNTAQEQAPGSLTTSMKGTLAVDLLTSTIQFVGQSQAIAENSGSWEPGLGGASGNAPANYGAKASSLLGSAKVAARNIQLDVTSIPLTISGGQFDSSTLVFGLITNSAATLDYAIAGFYPLSGSLPLVGYSTNRVATKSALVTAGDTQTLTIPVDARFLFRLVSSDDTVLNIKGQLVATRQASSPLSIANISVASRKVTLIWTNPPGQSFQVLGTRDFKNWTNRAANITSATNRYTWTGDTRPDREFFRLAK